MLRVPDAAYKPLTGDDKDTTSIYRKINAATEKGQGGFDFGSGISTLPPVKPLTLDSSRFRELPKDTVKAIKAKAARYELFRICHRCLCFWRSANLAIPEWVYRQRQCRLSCLRSQPSVCQSLCRIACHRPSIMKRSRCRDKPRTRRQEDCSAEFYVSAKPDRRSRNGENRCR